MYTLYLFSSLTSRPSSCRLNSRVELEVELEVEEEDNLDLNTEILLESKVQEIIALSCTQSLTVGVALSRLDRGDNDIVTTFL